MIQVCASRHAERSAPVPWDAARGRLSMNSAAQSAAMTTSGM